MNTLVFATNNNHKLEEVRAILGSSYNIAGLKDIGCFDDIPETAASLEGNALQKAEFIAGRYGLDCFADDTGLEIDALNGAPGVYSARFAGEEHDPQKNMQKVLALLDGCADRSACFRTIIALIEKGRVKYFEGKVCGRILETPRGSEGFGYDPIFIPDGYSRSFAELSPDEKNSISHRAAAVKKLAAYLRSRPLPQGGW